MNIKEGLQGIDARDVGDALGIHLESALYNSAGLEYGTTNLIHLNRAAENLSVLASDRAGMTVEEGAHLRVGAQLFVKILDLSTYGRILGMARTRYEILKFDTEETAEAIVDSVDQLTENPVNTDEIDQSLRRDYLSLANVARGLDASLQIPEFFNMPADQSRLVAMGASLMLLGIREVAEATAADQKDDGVDDGSITEAVIFNPATQGTIFELWQTLADKLRHKGAGDETVESTAGGLSIPKRFWDTIYVASGSGKSDTFEDVSLMRWGFTLRDDAAIMHSGARIYYERTKYKIERNPNGLLLAKQSNFWTPGDVALKAVTGGSLVDADGFRPASQQDALEQIEVIASGNRYY